MSLWKDVIRPYILEDEQPVQVTTSTPAPVPVQTILKQPEHPSVVSFRATGEVDPAFLNALSEEVNEDTDPKLLQFLKLFSDLSSIIPDERTRFQAAMVSAAQQGLEMSHLIQAAQDRLALVDRETQEFEADMKTREEQSIGQKQAQADQVGQQIIDLQRQITELGARQTEMQTVITGEQQKLAVAKQHFNSARDALREKFSKELELIRSNVKS